MAGMRALGRLYDAAVGAASGAIEINLENCSAVGVLVKCSTTASSTLTYTAAKVYGSSETAAGIAVFPATYYTRADSTAAWTDNTAGWTTVTSTGVATCSAATTGHVYYTDFLTDFLVNGYSYLKVAASADFQVVLLPHDLTVQRTPANLAILSV